MSNKEAERLLEAYRRELELLEYKKKELQMEEINVNVLLHKARAVCTHPTTEVIEGWDYHNGVDETYVICLVCGKTIYK